MPQSLALVPASHARHGSYTSQVLGSAVFAAATTGILAAWATERHNKYLAEFPAYPKSRNVVIPFVY